MTKKLLLAASAMGALAFAGAAGANEITAAKLSNVTVYTAGAGTPSTPYPVASETVSLNATRLTTGTAGHNTVSIELEDGVQRGALYQFTLNLTNAAFTAALGNTHLTAQHADAADCFTITKAGTTGLANASSVTYSVAVAASGVAACTLAETDVVGLTFDAASLRAGAIAGITAQVIGGLSSSNTLIGADDRANINQTITMASVVTGYDSRINGVLFDLGGDAGSDTMLGLDDHSYIKGDSLIGTAGYAPATLTGYGSSNAYLGFGATALPTVESDVELVISGTDFETLVPAGFTVDEDDVNYAIVEDATSFVSVDVSVAAGIDSTIATGPVTVMATVTPKAATSNGTAVVLAEPFSGMLETIQLEGTSFLAPWVQSSNPNYNTVLRLSNSGSRPSGQVQLALTSPLRAPSATTCTLPGVPANGELAISSAQLTTCFGDFGRGDVTITVLSVGDAMTAKLRIVSPGNVVSEQTLNQTSGAGI